MGLLKKRIYSAKDVLEKNLPDVQDEQDGSSDRVEKI
jgi:hypothetical protein